MKGLLKQILQKYFFLGFLINFSSIFFWWRTSEKIPEGTSEANLIGIFGEVAGDIREGTAEVFLKYNLCLIFTHTASGISQEILGKTSAKNRG